MAEVVIVAEALENHVPEGDQRSKGAPVKGLLREGQPTGQPGGRQQLVEEPKQLARRAAGAQQRGRGRCLFLGRAAAEGVWFKGVFLDDM